MTTRRTFLSLLGSLPAGAWGASSWLPMIGVRANRGGEEMDEALEMLAPYGASFRGGLSNHGPMTAEALVSLGRQDAVVGWVDRYRKRLAPRPAARERIDPANWRDALSDGSRSGDWDQWFANELAEGPWRDVLARWVPRLAPGMAAAGFHSAIRAGHAVCSLAVVDNALRRDELARALGYWAAEYLPLPGQYTGPGKSAPSVALAQVDRLPDKRRRSRGLISTQLKELRGFEPFTDVIGLVDPAAGSPTFMTDLVATFAGTFTNTTTNSFDFLHAITGAAAMAELLPYLEPEQRAEVQAYTWQATAAIFARYSRPGLNANVDIGDEEFGGDETAATEAATKRVEQLAKLAVASGDEHTIKLTAACRREWLRNPDPRLLAAASKRNGRR